MQIKSENMWTERIRLIFLSSSIAGNEKSDRRLTAMEYTTKIEVIF